MHRIVGKAWKIRRKARDSSLSALARAIPHTSRYCSNFRPKGGARGGGGISQILTYTGEEKRRARARACPPPRRRRRGYMETRRHTAAETSKWSGTRADPRTYTYISFSAVSKESESDTPPHTNLINLYPGGERRHRRASARAPRFEMDSEKWEENESVRRGPRCTGRVRYSPLCARDSQ